MTIAAARRPGRTLTLHKGQREVINDHRRFKVTVAGRRWGKTQCSKTAIIKRARIPRQLIWYVAPTYRMARGIMWQELLDAIPPALIARKHETLLIIRLVNGTQIELKGADKPDTLRGVGLHYLVMDEAQDIKHDTWTKVLRPTLASTRGDALFIGTPKAYNWLYEIYMLGQRGDTYVDKKGKRHINAWKSWQFPTITSPFIPKSEIEAARADMDEKSFRQEFEACHLPETQILLTDGSSKQISSIVAGDNVIHIDATGRRVASTVLRAGETGSKVIMDAILETGEVVSASAHHKFKVHHAT